MTNADAIRDLANKYGWNHSNTWFVDKLERPPYSRYVTQQQVQHTASTLRMRRMLDPQASLYKSCKKFLTSCDNDENLAKRLIKNVLYENRGGKYG